MYSSGQSLCLLFARVIRWKSAKNHVRSFYVKAMFFPYGNQTKSGQTIDILKKICYSMLVSILDVISGRGAVGSARGLGAWV